MTGPTDSGFGSLFLPPLTVDAWPAFFAAVHGDPDRRPFRWQTRLLEMLLADGVWPEQIAAPTGAGKTAVIDVHVFAVAMMAVGAGPRVPRRLALVVDRRVLVDDQYEHALAVAAKLADPDHRRDGRRVRPDPALAAVAAALGQLRWKDTPTVDGRPSPLVTARLRGGIPAPTAWRDDPAAAAVLCATPDMWGSRLLLRGYGSSVSARPREAGLLARDAVVVIDEAHLARQLVRTARRVAELQELTGPREVGVPVLRVVETTATPDPGVGRSVGVDEDDLTVDEVLRARLCRPKPVEIVDLPAWPSGKAGRPRDAAAARLADEVVRVRGEVSGGTVGCFVNTVSAAVAAREALRGSGLTVEILVGRMRPYDVDRLRHRWPGLLDVGGNEAVDVLVATQTLEVGIDVDLAGAVSELAPGTALAQRAGRVNRRGRRDTAPFVVLTGGDLPKDDHLGPYRTEDLTEALAWVRRRAAHPDGIAPWALRPTSDGGDPPPGQRRRRTLLQRVEPADTWHWASTSDDLAADPDLTLWLSDDVNDTSEIGIVVRRELPEDDADLVDLIRDLPPRDHEIFPVPLRQARDVLRGLVQTGRGADGPAEPLAPPDPLIRVRDRDVVFLRNDRDLWSELLPGDVVVVADTARIFRSGVVDPDGDQQADDVLDAADLSGASQPSSPGRPAGRALRLERPKPGEDELVDAVLDTAIPAAADRPSRNDRDRLADALTALAQAPRHADAVMTLTWAAARLRDRRERIKDTAVVLHRALDNPPHRLLVIDQARRLRYDDELRQTCTVSADPVTLTSHSADVASRAAELARAVGLGDDHIAILRHAGQHHDDGKIDERFQAMLRGEPQGGQPAGGAAGTAKTGSTSGSEGASSARSSNAGGAGGTDGASGSGDPLAKSRVLSRPRPSAFGLPAGWRHEQLSVLVAWPRLANLPGPSRALVARLVGTSHGRGRRSFPHTTADLLPGVDTGDRTLAEALFDQGGWDELIDETTRTWGVWGCAYLEALLRAADGQVSAEGK